MNLGAAHALAEICRVRHRVSFAFARALTVKSNHVQCECEPDGETHSGCYREQALVPVAPRQKLEQQHRHAMHDECPIGGMAACTEIVFHRTLSAEYRKRSTPSR